MCIAGLERIQGRNMTHAKKEKQSLTAEMYRNGVTAVDEVWTTRADARRMRAIIAMGISFMMRISEIIDDGETEHFIRWDGVRWEKIDGPKGIRITNGVTITIKSSKKKKAPVERSLGATG